MPASTFFPPVPSVSFGNRAIRAGLVASALLISGCAGNRLAARNTLLAAQTQTALETPSPLMPYIASCRSLPSLTDRQDDAGTGGADTVALVHLTPPVGTHHRPVDIGEAPDSVSVQSGHRLMYAFPDAFAAAGYFFANVKIERSDSAEYTRDKEILARSYRLSIGAREDYSTWSVNGLPVHAVEADTLDHGGVIGMYTAFLDRDHLVITAYLLNQGTAHRRYDTMAEYRAVRDRFLDGLTACALEAAPATAPPEP